MKGPDAAPFVFACLKALDSYKASLADSSHAVFLLGEGFAGHWDREGKSLVFTPYDSSRPPSSPLAYSEAFRSARIVALDSSTDRDLKSEEWKAYLNERSAEVLPPVDSN